MNPFLLILKWFLIIRINANSLQFVQIQHFLFLFQFDLLLPEPWE